ncbi:Spo0B domain-containing protein [Lentibacillus jeotgali]|uniref:Spo0B domain-containing protein n=1 Tax=Lentibacillus jeotgali TaxID=558169 RepID=UPI0002626C38|nr:Spo0B domain-containing protein [Lentibacillus jeotgali]
MKETDVIQILRHYRHDLMNHLQIIQGYLSMGKTDKVQKKLKDYMGQLQEEGRVVNLNAPKFALYLLQFNFLHTNFRMTYHIRTANKSLQSVDELLAERCEKVMKTIVKLSDEMQLYELVISLFDVDQDMIGLEFAVNGKFPDNRALIETMESLDWDMTIQQREDEFKCTVSIP